MSPVPGNECDSAVNLTNTTLRQRSHERETLRLTLWVKYRFVRCYERQPRPRLESPASAASHIDSQERDQEVAHEWR